ncbi:MAG: amidohydrolase family protein [Thermoleophilia bacterium]|nr:amidohydrolase family protein [Thermoleophilia bacterium]
MIDAQRTDAAGRTTTLKRWWAPWTLPVTAQPVRDALIEFDSALGTITKITANVSRDEAAARGAELFDNSVLAPGFVNAHAHIEYAAYDALTDGLSFTNWIGDHIQRKRRLSSEHMRASAELGAAQCAAGGITCVGDASYSGDAAHALVGAGLRGRVYLEVFGTINETEALASVIERLAGLPSSELVELGISPHAPYTASRKLYELVAASGFAWTTHLLESHDEVRALYSRSGPLAAAMERATGLPVTTWETPPVVGLEDLLGRQALVVHLVHATTDDIAALARTNTPVVHCPRSNARLGCGVFDLDAFDRAGVVVALGTDSPSSAGPLDMFAEMRSAIEQHRATNRDGERPSCAQVLRMATVEGAAALGYDGLGELREGAPADIVACEVGVTSNATVSYVLGATPNDVCRVVVAGKEVWRRGRNDLLRAQERAADARALLALPVSLAPQTSRA